MPRWAEDSDDWPRMRQPTTPTAWELPAAAELLRGSHVADGDPAVLALARVVMEALDRGR